MRRVRLALSMIALLAGLLLAMRLAIAADQNALKPAAAPRPNLHFVDTDGRSVLTIPSDPTLLVAARWEELDAPSTEPATQPFRQPLLPVVARMVHAVQETMLTAQDPNLTGPQRQDSLNKVRPQILDTERGLLQTNVLIDMQVVEVAERDMPKQPMATSRPGSRYRRQMQAYEEEQPIFDQIRYVVVGKLPWQAETNLTQSQRDAVAKADTQQQTDLANTQDTFDKKANATARDFDARLDTLTNQYHHGRLSQTDYNTACEQLQSERSDALTAVSNKYQAAVDGVNNKHTAAIKTITGDVEQFRPQHYVYSLGSDPSVLKWHVGQNVTVQGAVWKLALFTYDAQGKNRPFYGVQRMRTLGANGGASDPPAGQDGAPAAKARTGWQYDAAMYVSAEIVVKQTAARSSGPATTALSPVPLSRPSDGDSPSP